MRIPKPFYRRQTKTWYVQLGKKQHNLGPDQEKAKQKYHVLMTGRQVASDSASAATIIGAFLVWSREQSEDSTHEFYSRPLLSFVQSIGTSLCVGALKPFHVTHWLGERYKGKSDNYRRNAIRAVQRAFNWAVREGYIEKSPVRACIKPGATPRDVLISPELWNQLVAVLQTRGKPGQAFLDLLMLMRHTGCRPLEARTAEARHLDRKDRCLVFERKVRRNGAERNESKGGLVRRVVPLTDEAFEMCSRLAKKNPNGPIFRNGKGNPWDRGQMKQWFKRIDGSRKTGRGTKRPSERPKLDVRLSAYAIRHTWATEALTRGVDVVSVATIMGHEDLKQLMETYQHLNRKGDHIRAMLHVAVGATPMASQAPAASPA
jgi:integrase